MPIHDWSRIDAGLFHDFYQTWTIELRNALNGGVLPAGYFALAEQIHKAIWGEIHEEPFQLPADKPLTVAAYCAGLPHTAYVEPVAVGDPLPSLPIFLDPDTYVPAPLEETYQAAWSKSPSVVKELVEPTSR